MFPQRIVILHGLKNLKRPQRTKDTGCQNLSNQGVKPKKFKALGFRATALPEFLLSKVLFCSILKKILPLKDIFQLLVSLNMFFLRNSSLRSILVICWELLLMKIETLIYLFKKQNFHLLWQGKISNSVLHYMSTQICHHFNSNLDRFIYCIFFFAIFSSYPVDTGRKLCLLGTANFEPLLR